MVVDALLIDFLPLPDFFDEILATQVVPGETGFGQFAFHQDLCGNAGVIGSRHPQRVFAEHAVPAHGHVDQRVLEHVADVQLSCHVRRGYD